MLTHIDQLEVDIRKAEASAERQRELLRFEWSAGLMESAVVLLEYFERRVVRLQAELDEQIQRN
jgi:hypothetical protein